MPHFPPGLVYAAMPLDALYWRYSLRCRVEREEDKAYYWPQLSQLHEALLPLIAGWQDIRLNSGQALNRMIGKPDQDGCFRATLRNAPLGGLQKLTRERLEKVGSRFLSDNAHLIDAFGNGGRLDARLFEPRGRERVHFFLTEIFAPERRLKYDRSMTFQAIPHDLYLRIGGYDHQYATSRAHPLNQALDLYLWQGALAEAEADELVRRIGALAHAVHIWKAETGFSGEAYIDPQDGNHKLRYWVGDQIEDAIDGRNRYGSLWTDLLAQQNQCASHDPPQCSHDVGFVESHEFRDH